MTRALIRPHRPITAAAGPKTIITMSNKERRSLQSELTISFSDASSQTKSRVVSPSSLPPFGKSLFPLIWRLDPNPNAIKSLLVVSTTVALCALLFLPSLFVIFTDMNGDWDDRHKVDSIMSLMESTLGLSPAQTMFAFAITVFLFGGLMIADMIIGNDKNIYPSSWETNNTTCYSEMFSEPTRLDRLVRRPGNTLSNATYLFGSLCILLSTPKDNAFYVADFMFGVMLFILAISSTIWHGCNSPASQYPDLWSMDCCILYMIIRWACFGGMCFFLSYNKVFIRKLAGWICAVGFMLAIYKVGRLQQRFFQKRWLHGSCPFSVRSRLVGKSDLFGQGHADIRVSTVCAYAALPVYFSVIPSAVQVLFVGSLGSSVAANLAFRTLVVGWTYRLVDRWTLDGCLVLNWITEQRPKTWLGSTCRTIGAAIFSPTAVLHAMTGITLLTGYMYARSVDSIV